MSECQQVYGMSLIKYVVYLKSVPLAALILEVGAFSAHLNRGTQGPLDSSRTSR